MPDLVIARALNVAGEAYAHNALGELRALDEGDLLLEGETVFTPEGCELQLELMDGTVVLVRESSRREIDRELLTCAQRVLEDQPLPQPSGARFRGLQAGDVVQTASGHNLFFNERPLYWSIDGDHTCVRAVAHVNCNEEFIDLPVLEVQLGGEQSCSLTVEEGEFSIETHNVPFSTGDPEPGMPAKFFGISELGASGEPAEVADNGAVMSADIHAIGVPNNWYWDGDDIVFEFLPRIPELSDPRQYTGPRLVNNFSFRNTANAQAAFLAKAYRDGGEAPVFEAGSEACPVKLAPGAVFTMVAPMHYDRLVLTPVDESNHCRKLALHLEGFSEFQVAEATMRLEVKGSGRTGEAAVGHFNFLLPEGGGDYRELQFETATRSIGYDSVWEQLGLQSALSPREHH